MRFESVTVIMRNRRCPFRNLLTLCALLCVPAGSFVCRPSAASAFSGTESSARRAACKASRPEGHRSVMTAQGGGGKGDHYVSETGAKLNKGVCKEHDPPAVVGRDYRWVVSKPLSSFYRCKLEREMGTLFLSGEGRGACRNCSISVAETETNWLYLICVYH